VNAAIYARYSTEKQNDASIEDQVRGCERLAAANNLTIVARFEDRGISGGTTERPGYQALLTAARAGAFTVILAEDISRLWRNRSEFGQRSCELEDLSVHLMTCVGDDTRRDGYGLVVAIKSAIAETARREISYRTRRGLEGRARAGASTGGRTYGYAAPGVVDPAQAAVVARAFNLYASGLTDAKVAEALNATGGPCAPRGGPWQASTVGALLSNPRYTGRVQWGAYGRKRSSADSGRVGPRIPSAAPAVSRQDDALVIIDRTLWNTVSAERTRRAKVYFAKV
jgi:site-specific DNA recombinase